MYRNRRKQNQQKNVKISLRLNGCSDPDKTALGCPECPATSRAMGTSRSTRRISQSQTVGPARIGRRWQRIIAKAVTQCGSLFRKSARRHTTRVRL